MAYQSIIPYDPYCNCGYEPSDNLGDDEYRVALESGAANYGYWLRMIFADRIEARLRAATIQSIIPYDPHGCGHEAFDSLDDDEYRDALEMGAANYEYWLRMILADRAEARLKAAAIMEHEAEPCTAQHPVDDVPQMEQLKLES